MAYDFNKPFMDVDQMDSYRATNAEIMKKFGSIVKAIGITNREYIQRFDEFSGKNNMKLPPSSHIHVYPGYLVVRNYGKSNQYETWIPDGAFDEMYERIDA